MNSGLDVPIPTLSDAVVVYTFPVPLVQPPEAADVCHDANPDASEVKTFPAPGDPPQ